MRAWPVLEEMLTLFYPPFRAEDDEELLNQSVVALRRYVSEIGTLEPDVLERRWADCLRVHKTERWPTIAAIMAVEEGSGRTEGYVAGMKQRESDKERVQDLLANVLFGGSLGQRAAQEGWCYELKLFLEREKRTPLPAEVERMKTAYDRVKATMADMERREAAGEDLMGMASLRGIYNHMPHREARLAEQILNRAAA